jgi:phosphatidylserine synthase
MVSTIRFRSVKAIDVGWHRSYFGLFLLAVGLALVASQPRIALVALAYTYTVVALIVWAWSKVRKRSDAADGVPAGDTPPGDENAPPAGDIQL